MLTKAETITFYVFLSLVLVGAVNWGIQAFSGRDLIAILVNAAKRAGGSNMQKEFLVLYEKDTASIVIPRVVYALVFCSAIIVIALLIKGAASGGPYVIPQLK